MEGSGESVDAPPVKMNVLVDAPWWQPVVAGLITLIIGGVAMAWPDITLWFVIVLFGAIMFIQGIMAIIASFVVKNENPMWVVMFLVGPVSVILGGVIMAWPDLTALVVLYIIAAWFLIMGMLMVVWGFRHRAEEVPGRTIYMILGLMAVVFSFVAFLYPDATALSIVWLIGLFAVIFGVLMVIAGFVAKGQQ